MSMPALVGATAVLTAPLVLAAMGGYTSERSGVTNIALEGKMLASACVTVLMSVKFGAYVGVTSGVLTAILFSLLHWLATQHYRMDHVISGMAINAIAFGGTNFLYGKFADRSANDMPALPMAFYYVVAVGAPIVLWLYSRYTRGGLRLLAVGSDPDKARLMGVQPSRIRFVGLLTTGLFTGLGGAVLVTDATTFTDGMTAGRGYIALAALILGGWRPLPAALACLAFGFFSALRIVLQGTTVYGISLPSQAWASLPYLVTLIALAGFLGRNRTPAGIGKL